MGTYGISGSYGQGVEEHIEYAVRIDIVPDEPQTLGWFDRVQLDCQNLLILLVGEYIAPVRLIIDRSHPEGVDEYWNPNMFAYTFSSLRRQHSATPDSTSSLLRFKTIRKEFEQIAQKWFEKAERLRPTHELLFGSMANEAMYPNFQFLALMQALETYLRREREGNYLSVELYEPFCRQMVQSLPDGLSSDHKQSLKSRVLC